MAPREEFAARVARLNEALAKAGHTVGLVFSDEHYRGDVPYLGGNTNLSIEQVAGVVGPNGFHVVAGLEGGYVAEQLAGRAGAVVHKVELLQLADEKYPIRAERLEDVIEAAAGRKVDHIALLTPRQVIPAGLVEYVEGLFGRDGVVDAQEIYYRVKYEKSDIEMRHGDSIQIHAAQSCPGRAAEPDRADPRPESLTSHRHRRWPHAVVG
jgi:hypothetical protein